MRRLAAGLFWASVLHVGYTYVGYAALALLRARLTPRPHRTDGADRSAAVVICAYNEAEAIEAKLASVLALDYPSACLQIIVASDGSTDETVDRARRVGGERVLVLDLPRQGKAGTLNAALRHVEPTAEIVVFTDGNSVLDPNALRAIVAPFADPEVGGVAGDQRYTADGDGDSSRGERSYWDFDRTLKRAESAAGSIVGATGALYAVRRSLVPTVPGHVNDDFYVSATVVASGHRLVFSPDAIAFEPAAGTPGLEFQRKVRIITRALYTELALRRLANPARAGWYAVTFVSHKVMRHLVAVPLLLIAATSVALARRGPIYRLALVGQVVVYGLAAVGWAAPGSPLARHRMVALTTFFSFANAAALAALVNVVRGRRIDRWTKAGPPGTMGSH